MKWFKNILKQRFTPKTVYILGKQQENELKDVHSLCFVDKEMACLARNSFKDQDVQVYELKVCSKVL